MSGRSATLSTANAELGVSPLAAAPSSGVRARGAGRARILAEALRLFGSRDYSDVSMSEVASAAGVTKAALYYHFADKESLYFETSLQSMEVVRVAVAGAIEGEGTLEERLIRGTVVGFESLQSGTWGRLHSHEHLDEARHTAVHVAMERVSEPIVELLREAAPSSPAVTAKAGAAFLGALGAIVFFVTAGPGASVELPTDPTERARLIVRLFLYGYLAQDARAGSTPTRPRPSRQRGARRTQD